MARNLGSTLAAITASGKYEIDVTLDLSFPDTTELHVATSPLVAVNGHDYQNFIDAVGEIKLSIESPIDGVQVSLQNKDGVLGVDLAANWQNWSEAAAVLGKLYYEIGDDGLRTGTKVWQEFFRGDLFDPNADDNDKQVKFQIIPDTVSPGEIVCNRTEAPKCPFIYKHPSTCGATSLLPTCNHCLASPDGCDGRANNHHFGGCEHRYQAEPAAPSGGGDTGGGGGDNDPPCPRKDQYVRIKGKDGRPIPHIAGLLKKTDMLWNPILHQFKKIGGLELVKNEPIWEAAAPRGIRGFSSARHPLIRHAADDAGTAVDQLNKSNHFLVEDDKLTLEAVRCRSSRDTGQTGDVVRITIDAETDIEKIYCYSDTADGPFIVCHNVKLNP